MSPPADIPTPLTMTVQEALATLRDAADSIAGEYPMTAARITVAEKILSRALADAERRATEAEAEIADRQESEQKTVRAWIAETDARKEAERRATEAEEEMNSWGATATQLFDERAELQSRLSAVEARCGLMREALQGIVKYGPNGGNLNANVTITLPLRALYDGKTALAYPGGKSEEPADYNKTAATGSNDSQPITSGGKSDQGEKEKP